MTDSALIVFAKVPRPGHVKTRLTPVLTPEEAARLYRAFLRDALAQYAEALSVDVRLYLAPPVPEAGIDGVPADVEVFEQAGEGLGTRMARAFRETLGAGYKRACIIGTDHPTLPSSFVRQAFQALEGPESVCIGPSDDGGYYLLGMNAVRPELFDGMHYSHPRVFADTLARAAQTGARLTILPRWYDVDTPTALERLIHDLPNAAPAAPNTRAAIQAMDLKRIAGQREA